MVIDLRAHDHHQHDIPLLPVEYDANAAQELLAKAWLSSNAKANDEDAKAQGHAHD